MFNRKRSVRLKFQNRIIQSSAPTFKHSNYIYKIRTSINRTSIPINRVGSYINEVSTSINGTRDSINKTDSTINEPSTSIYRLSSSINRIQDSNERTFLAKLSFQRLDLFYTNKKRELNSSRFLLGIFWRLNIFVNQINFLFYQFAFFFQCHDFAFHFLNQATAFFGTRREEPDVVFVCSNL